MALNINKSIIIILCFFTAVICSSCKKDNDVTPPFDPDKVQIDYDALSATAIDEFIAFAKTPRMGGHMEKARDYLINWAIDHGFQPQSDATDNIWFDVPATKGLENYPKVILQGHMDMICACKPDETYDFTQKVGTPYYEGEGDNKVLKGKDVNLGVDNGIGVSTAMAIVSMDVPHGPLRILFTTNEDYDLSGARELANDVIDAPYLINIDSETIGTVIYGCAGSINFNISKEFDTTILTDASQYNKVTIKVSNLKGGHSGLDIGSHRLSGSVITDSIVKSIIRPFGAKIIKIDCGTYVNAIPSSTQIEFAVKHSDASMVFNKISAIKQIFEKDYPMESAIWSIEVNGTVTENDICCDILSADKIGDLMKCLPQGILENNAQNRITKSNNIGVINLSAGKLNIRVMERSDYDEWLDNENLRIKDAVQSFGMTYNLLAALPAWNSDGKDALTQMMIKYYNIAGYETVMEKSLGGLETGFFVHKNPHIKCVSVGPTIENAHSIDEALYVNTVKPLIQVIIQTLLHVNTI